MTRDSRRQFLQSSAALVAGASAANLTNRISREQGGRQTAVNSRPAFIATWNFGQAVCDEALRVVDTGASMEDAIEAGIRLCEADAGNASVGIGGTPNADGVVQLDAVFMTGPGHRAGSVAALEGIAHPISVARQVMEKTDHVLLVGDGAQKFALENGHDVVDLLTENRRQAWETWRKEQSAVAPPARDDHDTITLVGVDAKGDVYGGCSTSGRGYKLPGRVGDSPIIGSGLYVDNEVGAAGATGIGENVMRYCASFLIVELMRQGLEPTEACVRAIERVVAQDPRPVDQLEINFIAINRAGEFGAAGTSKGFQYAYATHDDRGVRDARRIVN